MSKFTKPVTDANFDSEVLKANIPVLVDFWAEWCGPCQALGPKLEEVAHELQGKVNVVKVNVDENPTAPARYGVRGIPTMILFKGGQIMDQVVGNVPKDSILAVLKRHI